jgi:hypothetical protein
MSSQPDYDWMALADAFGVNATPEQAAPAAETVTNWSAHPCHQHEFTDPALAAILANWSRAAAGADRSVLELFEDLADTPVPFVVTDHDDCANPDCDRQVCMCDTPCPGVSERWCLHNNVLCDDCRLECTDCANDYRQDGA